jgi:hypothetical protein
MSKDKDDLVHKEGDLRQHDEKGWKDSIPLAKNNTFLLTKGA